MIQNHFLVMDTVTEGFCCYKQTHTWKSECQGGAVLGGAGLGDEEEIKFKRTTYGK